MATTASSVSERKLNSSVISRSTTSENKMNTLGFTFGIFMGNMFAYTVLFKRPLKDSLKMAVIAAVICGVGYMIIK